MEPQLRIYRIRDGELDDFVREWTEGVLPLRRRHGFEVPLAWVSEEESTFVWLLEYRGDGDFAEAERAHYASPERQNLDPDPARRIVDGMHLPVRPQPLP